MYRVSQLIASNNADFSLKNDSRTIVISFMNNYDIDPILVKLRSADLNSGSNLSLHFEHLTGNNFLPVIEVYLNLDNENEPKETNYVGSMALYGLKESSRVSHGHVGSGQDWTFDVGEVFNKVRGQSNWSTKQFKLTLIPYQPLSTKAVLTIGCIELYFNEN
jgi:hypothetical protein